MSHPRRDPDAGLPGEGTEPGTERPRDGEADSLAGRLGRRLLITRVALGAAALAVLAPRAAEAQVHPAQYRSGLTDSDPNDSPGYGRGQRRPRTGLTDADPNDGAGYGRGGGRARTGLTDADPNDGAGYGRGGYRGGGRARTGLTDADPNDGAGYGRGGGRRRTGLTDSDPSDGAGYGRGGWR